MILVKIGHAVHDENGRSKGGKPGDQTGKEVYVADWYIIENSPWKTVFRAKKTKTANKIAAAMEKACANDNIGYDQNDRTTLYTLAKTNDWQIDKVGKCETDCSALVSVCVNTAGISVSKDMYTGNEKEVLSNTGKFDILEDKKYLLKPDYLKRGDILLKSGHTAIVLTVTEVEDEITVIKAKKSPESKDNSLKGTYAVEEPLNMRDGAGTSFDIIVTMKAGSMVTCDGSYTERYGTKWLYVTYETKSKRYIGFCSSKYLKKETPVKKATKEPEEASAKLAGTYVCTASSLNMRNGAGTGNSVMTCLSKGAEVTCDGQYTSFDGTKWLYVTYVTPECIYIGFCSSRYLEKK